MINATGMNSTQVGVGTMTQKLSKQTKCAVLAKEAHRDLVMIQTENSGILLETSVIGTILIQIHVVFLIPNLSKH